MDRLLRVCLFATLALAVCLLAAPLQCSADDKDDAADIKEAQKATEKLKKGG